MIGEAVTTVGCVGPMPAGLGLWPPGATFLLDGPDELLVSMEVAP
jgi:hypothetical protein